MNEWSCGVAVGIWKFAQNALDKFENHLNGTVVVNSSHARQLTADEPQRLRFHVETVTVSHDDSRGCERRSAAVASWQWYIGLVIPLSKARNPNNARVSKTSNSSFCRTKSDR